MIVELLMWCKISNESISEMDERGLRHITMSATQELKLAEFSHENIGQLNTYVSWYKKNMMLEGDNPPFGILLCSHKKHSLVEFALAGMDNQLFVSKYQLELPKREEIERFLADKLQEAVADE